MKTALFGEDFEKDGDIRLRTFFLIRRDSMSCEDRYALVLCRG